MENFNYLRPATVADAVKAMKKAKDGKFLSGGHDAAPDDEAAPCGARPTSSTSAGLKNAGIKVGAKSVTIGAGTTHADVASCKRPQEGHSRPGRPRRRHRRSARAPPGHDRRLDRQQRPGGRLSGGLLWASAPPSSPTSRKIAADDFFTGMFSTALEDARDRHGGRVPDAEEGRLRQVPEPGLALCPGRRVRGQARRRLVRVAVTGAGAGRVPRARAGSGAEEALLGARRSTA